MSEAQPPGTALVVGGSGGLGEACALRLAAAGHRVLLTWHQDKTRAEAVAARIEAEGGDATIHQLTLPDGPLPQLDGLETVVFAAGADIGQPYISELDPAELRAAVDLELHGFFATCKATLPALRDSRGSIVALVSAGGRRWPPGDALSVVPKAGIEALVRGFAREEGRYGVRANAVAVGVAEGGIFHRVPWSEDWLEAARANIALRRFAAPSEVAEAVAFLASRRASYITGQVLHVDGGYAI